MNITAEVANIETAIKSKGLKLDEVLDTAGINRSTWTRWKSGTTKPRLENWIAIKTAVEGHAA